MKGFSSKKSGLMLLMVTFVFFGSLCFAQAGDVSLPRTMIWSCYDVGSTGYVQASAIADAFVKKYGIRIRLLPSGTSIGRLMPVTTKRVSCGFLANEVYFAAEGLYDFSTIEWGPQDLRVLMGQPTTVGLATPKDAGIRTFKDLKGKRLSYVPGADTLNIKMDAWLAFAGLTWNDVQRVEFSSYAASLKALIEGKTDGSVSGPTASILYELESSPKGIYWVPFPKEDKEGWKRMLKTCPFLSPGVETVGPGLSEQNPVELPSYRYPMVTVYADADADWCYNFVKAMDETFHMYKGAHPVMPRWAIDLAGVPPADAPFHEGAIKYLREKGVWKAEHDAWNKERLGQIEKVQEAWEKALTEAEAQKMKSKDFPAFWLKERAKALGD